MPGKKYLKPTVQVDPLFNNWYAWPMLISPATSAMILKFLHLRILESFVKSPKLHQAAAKNPAMRGGMFLDYHGDVDNIRNLIKQTYDQLKPCLDLADAIKELDAILAREAVGHAMLELYPKVPDPLRGYVELGYDLNNRPTCRFIEPLLYRSPYYVEKAQSVMLSLRERDDRPFVLSTPRIKEADNLIINIPFPDKRLDALFRMKYTPGDPAELGDLLQPAAADDADRALLASMFTEEPPHIPPDRKYEGEGVRVRYYGHATIQIESRDITILLDPLVSYPIPGGLDRFSFQDLPDMIDYALLTHNHQDHVMFETLLQIRHRIKHLVMPADNGGMLQDPSLRIMFQQLGFENVIELREMESIPIPGGEITGIPFFGEHGDLHINTKLAYHVSLKDRTILCAADSNNIEPRIYDHLHRHLGDVDMIFIGMECDGAPLSWLYGPLYSKPLERKFDQVRRLDGSNFERALGIVERFSPKGVYIYAMGAEPWLTFILSVAYTEQSSPIIESNQLIEVCKARGILADRLYGKREFILLRDGIQSTV